MARPVPEYGIQHEREERLQHVAALHLQIISIAVCITVSTWQVFVIVNLSQLLASVDQPVREPQYRTGVFPRLVSITVEVTLKRLLMVGCQYAGSSEAHLTRK